MSLLNGLKLAVIYVTVLKWSFAVQQISFSKLFTNARLLSMIKRKRKCSESALSNTRSYNSLPSPTSQTFQGLYEELYHKRNTCTTQCKAKPDAFFPEEQVSVRKRIVSFEKFWQRTPHILEVRKY